VTTTWLALPLLRAVTGGLLIGHGAQKLCGGFGGKGLEGTGQSFEKMGLRPGREWAEAGGAAEVAGGVLTALGLLFPVGPIVATAPMIVAWRTAHRDKPIWVNQGGAELPVTKLTIAAALILADRARRRSIFSSASRRPVAVSADGVRDRHRNRHRAGR
jgi:putative oxidoreductase